jgi:prevent-host-death family protein
MKTKLVTTFKHQTTKSLTELHKSKETVLITKQGRPSVYLIDVEDYELMQSSMS